MSRPVIVACAVTGSADSTGVNPAVPVTPEEIANEAIAANKAGAAIAHIHVRNPDTGKASTEFKYYEEVVLLEQVWVLDGKTKVSKAVEDVAKAAGGTAAVTGFRRFALGEGIEREESDFAAEVAAQLDN